MERLRESEVPLTLCPLSNLRLSVVDDLRQHPLLEMLERGLLVTVNSDDPSYFGGYLSENYRAIQQALGLTREHMARLARHSFEASFLSTTEIEALVARLGDYLAHADGSGASRSAAGV